MSIAARIRTFLGRLWKDDTTGLTELDQMFCRGDLVDLTQDLGRACPTAKGAITIILRQNGEIQVASAGLTHLEAEALARKGARIIEGESEE